MAEGRSGVAKLNPDGTTGITVAGRRYTLGVPTLGDLEDLRSLYRDLVAEQEDRLELDYKPALQDLRAKVRAATDAAARKDLRAEVRKLEDEQEHLAQDSWATWWRKAFELLSRDPLPDFDQRPAEQLPVWMVESPTPISRVFAHWRSDPFGASGTPDLVEALQRLSGQDG